MEKSTISTGPCSIALTVSLPGRVSHFPNGFPHGFSPPWSLSCCCACCICMRCAGVAPSRAEVNFLRPWWEILGQCYGLIWFNVLCKITIITSGYCDWFMLQFRIIMVINDYHEQCGTSFFRVCLVSHRGWCTRVHRIDDPNFVLSSSGFFQVDPMSHS